MTASLHAVRGRAARSVRHASGEFDEDIHTIVTQAIVEWRVALAAKIVAAAEKHPPRAPLDPESLADLLTVVLEGAYIVARVFKQPCLLAEHLKHYRAYLQLLFAA